jgi:hypothetical protein
MPIARAEREKMLAVRLCGPRVIARLESIGIERLADLTGREPDDLVCEVNLEAGRPIWHAPMAIRAMANLVSAAERERSIRLQQNPVGADSGPGWGSIPGEAGGVSCDTFRIERQWRRWESNPRPRRRNGQLLRA